MQTYNQIQYQVGSWNIQNFGNQATPFLRIIPVEHLPHEQDRVRMDAPHGGEVVELGSLAPLMGLVEEMGELHEAKTMADLEDALGDITIYLCDYCCRESVQFPERVKNPEDGLACDVGIIVYLGRLYHCHLKRHQGIRHMDDNVVFKQRRQVALEGFVWHLEGYTRLATTTNLLTILNATWNRVKKRNWREVPTDGGGHSHEAGVQDA